MMCRALGQKTSRPTCDNSICCIWDSTGGRRPTELIDDVDSPNGTDAALLVVIENFLRRETDDSVSSERSAPVPGEKNSSVSESELLLRRREWRDGDRALDDCRNTEDERKQDRQWSEPQD